MSDRKHISLCLTDFNAHVMIGLATEYYEQLQNNQTSAPNLAEFMQQNYDFTITKTPDQTYTISMPESEYASLLLRFFIPS